MCALEFRDELGIVLSRVQALQQDHKYLKKNSVPLKQLQTDIAGRFIKAGSMVKDLRDQIESEYSKETESKLEKARARTIHDE